jgi:hypothetical protein
MHCRYFCLLPFAFCLAASLQLAACGYQFRVDGPGPVIGGAAAQPEGPPDKPPPRIRIMNFENKGFEPNIEIKYTAYTRHEFSAGSGAIVVSADAPADFILKGQILGVMLPSLAFTQGATLESRATVTVRALVEDAKTKKVVWDRVASASSEYFVTNDLQFNRVLETRALEQAGRLIAEDLATQFLNYLEAGPEKTKPGLTPMVPVAPEPPGKGFSGR